MVSNITSGFILNYINYISKDKISLEDSYKQLSVTLGGDGKTIKKADLENYISKAEKGLIDVSAKKLQYLKDLNNNWDKLFSGKDEISYEDFKNNIGSFAGIIVEDSRIEQIEYDKKDLKSYSSDNKSSKNEKLEIFNKYIDELKQKLNSDEKGLTKDNLKDYLNSLISKSDEDTDAAAEVGLVTNLISDFDAITGGKEYLNSLKEETQYEKNNNLSGEDFSSPVNFKI